MRLLVAYMIGTSFCGTGRQPKPSSSLPSDFLKTPTFSRCEPVTLPVPRQKSAGCKDEGGPWEKQRLPGLHSGHPEGSTTTPAIPVFRLAVQQAVVCTVVCTLVRLGVGQQQQWEERT